MQCFSRVMVSRGRGLFLKTVLVSIFSISAYLMFYASKYALFLSSKE